MQYVGTKFNEFRYGDHYEHVRRVSGFYSFIRPIEGKGKRSTCEQTPSKVTPHPEKADPSATPLNTLKKESNGLLQDGSENDAHVSEGLDYVTISKESLDVKAGKIVTEFVTYRKGDIVECRIEKDDKDDFYEFPKDRLRASLKTRWFKGEIKDFRLRHSVDVQNSFLGVNEKHIIEVNLHRNCLDKLAAPVIQCFQRRCPRLCKPKPKVDKQTQKQKQAKKQEIKSMHKRVLQTISLSKDQSDEDQSPENRAQHLANAFDTVAPVFTAVVGASSKAELEAARAQVRGQKSIIKGKQFELNTAMVALNEAEQRLNHPDQHAASTIIAKSEEDAANRVVMLQNEETLSKDRLAQRLDARKKPTRRLSKPRESASTDGIEIARPPMRSESMQHRITAKKVIAEHEESYQRHSLIMEAEQKVDHERLLQRIADIRQNRQMMGEITEL